jgi:hypothetical protein
MRVAGAGQFRTGKCELRGCSLHAGDDGIILLAYRQYCASFVKKLNFR